MTQVTVVRAESSALWSEARRLVEEYAALEADYGPPHGYFVLAGCDDAWIGCGGLRRLSASDCEMTRLYVSPAGRGRGAGRGMAEALIDAARGLGYRTMLLDTTPSMTRAQRIYTSLGSTKVAPYRYNPIEGASYWRLDLWAR
jgi:ribosomal protein S18 acetylase RimI-like enzyme